MTFKPQGKWCACAPFPVSRGMMSESLGLTSHKSSCTCTGCGMLRAGVCINCAEKTAALILESRRDRRRAVLGRLPRGDRAVLLHPARALARAAHAMRRELAAFGRWATVLRFDLDRTADADNGCLQPAVAEYLLDVAQSS